MSETSEQDLPRPEIRRRRRINPSLIWLVPVVAALVGIVLILRVWLNAGPEISISFETGEGLEVGKTEVKFKNVVVGKLRALELDDDRQHVIVKVDLSKDAEHLAVDDSRFWVVRPRADLGGVSGLSTLLSGAYIGVDVGKSSEPREEFIGLEVPPAVTNDQKGGRYLLAADDLGSLNIGSPIYFRRIPVGRIVGFELNPDGKAVSLQAFVDAPYNRYVTSTTRFWNASGFDVSIDGGGLKINTQSLVTLLAGGVAFQPLTEDDAGEPVGENTRFELYADQTTALAPPDGAEMLVALRFFQSLRGLTVGAPVDFKGVELGKVKTIRLEYDPAQRRFAGDVVVQLYPQRMGGAYQRLREREGGDDPAPELLFSRMVERGLRAQLRTGNLITGQLYVALDFLPKAKPAKVDPAQRPFEIPTEPGSLDQIQSQIADIVAKLDEIPFGDIGRNLRDTLGSADALLKQINDDIAPEAKKTLEEAQNTLDGLNRSLASPDAPLQQDARKTLEEVDRTARSLRNLADYLQRHPESLIRGKPKAAEPEPKE